MTKSKVKNTKKNRIIELDFFRGIAVLLMAFQHFIYDVRHVFGQNLFAFQDSPWFMDWFRAIIVFLFLLISGICSSFSRDNRKRAIRLLALALGLTIALEIISFFTKLPLHIYFNVFHLLGLGILLYSFIERKPQEKTLAIEEQEIARRKSSISKDERISLTLLLLAAVFLYLGQAVDRVNPIAHNLFFIFGLRNRNVAPMLDYMPLIPWFGFFLLGLVVGRIFYAKRRSLLSQSTENLLSKFPLISFLGRHALAFYVIHQVAFLLILGVFFHFFA